MSLVLPRLMLVTDGARTCGRTLESVITAAVAGGLRLVQLREPDLPDGELAAPGAGDADAYWGLSSAVELGEVLTSLLEDAYAAPGHIAVFRQTESADDSQEAGFSRTIGAFHLLNLSGRNTEIETVEEHILTSHTLKISTLQKRNGRFRTLIGTRGGRIRQTLGPWNFFGGR